MNQKDLQEIEGTITQAIERALLPDGRYNYYQATENLLEIYMTLKKIVEDFDEYAEDLQKRKSKSITAGSAQSGYRKTQEEIEDERMAEKMRSFGETKNTLALLDYVLNRFRSKRQFVVIERYYFNLGEDGQEREAERKSLAEIAEDLGLNEKTVRRWRSKMVKDISIIIFGLPAAASVNRVKNH